MKQHVVGEAIDQEWSPWSGLKQEPDYKRYAQLSRSQIFKLLENENIGEFENGQVPVCMSYFNS